jgi:hypothetical protein
MLSNYQFDKYLSAKKDENDEEKMKLPLENIYLQAESTYQDVSLVSFRC